MIYRVDHNPLDIEQSTKVFVQVNEDDVFDLVTTLAPLLKASLQKFKDTTPSYPCGIMEDEEIPFAVRENKTGMDVWRWVLDQMIYSFDLILQEKHDDQAHRDTVQEGLRFFANYYTNLWH